METKEIKQAIKDTARPLLIGLRNDIKDLTAIVKAGQTKSGEVLKMIIHSSNYDRSK